MQGPSLWLVLQQLQRPRQLLHQRHPHVHRPGVSSNHLPCYHAPHTIHTTFPPGKQPHLSSSPQCTLSTHPLHPASSTFLKSRLHLSLLLISIKYLPPIHISHKSLTLPAPKTQTQSHTHSPLPSSTPPPKSNQPTKTPPPISVGPFPQTLYGTGDPINEALIPQLNCYVLPTGAYGCAFAEPKYPIVIPVTSVVAKKARKRFGGARTA